VRENRRNKTISRVRSPARTNLRKCYLVSNTRVSVFCFVLSDVEGMFLGDVLPELGRALADEVADPAPKLACTS